MIQTGDGGYALAGQTTSLGAGLSDFWLVKTNPAGTSQWNKTYGWSNYDIAHSLKRTNDGGYAVAGSTQSSGPGTEDFFLVKTDSSGNAQWNKTYGGAKGDVAHSVVQSIDGGFALAGETQSYGAGAYDFWVIKVNSSGNLEWSKTYGGGGSDIPRFMLQTSDGGYALTGYTYSFGTGGSDFWLAKTDALGTAQWNKTFGGLSSDCAFSAVLTGDGGYALAGYTTSFGAGGYDFWLVKLTPSSIFIHADGSIDPLTAPLLRDGYIYSLTDDVYASATSGIVIERDDVVLNGAGYLLQGTGQNTGILVQERSNVTIKNMSIGGFAVGINLSDSSNNVIQANSISDCETGIGLFGFSSDNTVSENNITAINGYGIHIESSSNNLITRNNLRDNYGGMRLLQCTNIAYHNNFINNTVQVSALDSVNEWDNGYPSGGNYWSDYTGIDVDGDDIGNTPYVADAGNQDHNPLMTPYPYFSGDVNRDGIVNQLDLEMLNIAYSSTPTSTNWSSNADLNNDKIIDVQDLRILGKNFGKTTKQ
jgi:parallel beta-helix repeat protein